MEESSGFDLGDFLPYMLNQAAERTGLAFQSAYRDRYGMLRTEWRVLFHLGRHGPMTAHDISTRSRTHKTKVSRAVKALETRRFLLRQTSPQDRRVEILSLTRSGEDAFMDLQAAAERFDTELGALFSPAEQEVLRDCLRRIVERGHLPQA